MYSIIVLSGREACCKNISFIFHLVLTSNLVPEDDLFNCRVQTVLKKNKAVLQDNFVCSRVVFLELTQDIGHKLRVHKQQCCCGLYSANIVLIVSYLLIAQSSVSKIRSISISSPCHFYFMLYCFI